MVQLIRITWLLVWIMAGWQLKAQVIGIEGNTFSSVYSSTLSVKGNIDAQNIWGYSLMTRFDGDYQTMANPHTLVIGSMAYCLFSPLKATAGAVWSSGNQVKPSFGLQYFAKMKNWMAMFYPNVNIASSSHYMQVTMLQYSHDFHKILAFIRSRTLFIIDRTGHQFTTMRFQAGIERGRIGGGLSYDHNLYGSGFESVQRFGAFLSVTIFAGH